MMRSSFDKALRTIATLALCVIAIQLIPIARNAQNKIVCAEGQAIGEFGWLPKNFKKLNLKEGSYIRIFCSYYRGFEY